MSSVEQKHLKRIREHGCLVCGAYPVEAHHIREGVGMAEKAGDFLTIPLCDEHHRGAFSIHGSKKQFTGIYGSEMQLLNQTLKEVYGK